MLYGSRFVLAAAISCDCIATPAIAQPPQTRSLADLLQEAEEKIVSNIALSDARLSFQQASAVEEEVVRIAEARNAIVMQDGGLFKTMADATVAQERLAVSQQIWARSDVIRNHAQAEVANQQAIAIRIGKQPLGLQFALDTLRTAEQQEQQVRQEKDLRAKEFSDLCSRLMHSVPNFLERYDDFRCLLPHERGSRNVWLATAITNRQKRCPDHDWIEGELVLALALIYEGQDDDANSALGRATSILGRYPALYTTALAQDCCAAWLLLGKTRNVARYVMAVNEIPNNHRTAMQCWLLGAYARACKKRDQAAQQLKAAVDKAGRNPPPSLLAEAAFARLVAGSDKKHVQYAAELLGRLPNDDSWPALQSRAALAAAEERWEDAAALLDQCKERAPPCRARELEQQKEYYAKKKIWRP